MSQDTLFAGIDIGSSAVRIVIGQRLAMGEKDGAHILSAAEVPSEGIQRGVINSIEDAVSCVSACIEKAERLAGAQIGLAWIAMSGAHVTAQLSKGVIAVSRPDGEIREEDVSRALDAAQTVATPVNFEILHVIPRTYTIDGQAGVKDPVGMSGIRLEVDTQIIHGQTAHMKNLTRCVYRTGANVEGVVLGIMAAAEAVTTPRQRELGVAVVNIGSSNTSLIVYEQGDILHLATLPIGSDHVTADIAIGLRTSIDIAEKVKLNCARALAKEVERKDIINLREHGADGDEETSLKYVAEIVQARCEEIMEKIDKELKKIGRSGMLPAGIVLTGGGAKLPGLVELAKSRMRLPVSLGYPFGVTSVTDRVNDPAYTTAIGLVQWGIREAGVAGDRRKPLVQSLNVGKAVDKLKKLFKVGAK